MVNQLHEMLNRLNSKPFPATEFEHLNVVVGWYLEQYFKDSEKDYIAMDNFRAELPSTKSLPESLDGQLQWLSSYSSKLGLLLDEQRKELSTALEVITKNK